MVLYTRSGDKTYCGHCAAPFGPDFGEELRHYMTSHNYRILHVGTETTLAPINGQETVLYQTVAVMVRDKPQ